jgi:hypothetical protein
MLHIPHCPVCDEPLDETGACVACGWYPPDDPLEFDDDDLTILHATIEGE